MKSFIIILVSFVFALEAYSQGERQQIKKIDSMKLNILSNISKYKKIESVVEHNGYNWRFYNQDKIQLIIVNTKEDNIEKKVEWYFYNEQLIYEEQKWIDSNNKVINNEKYYLQNNHLIVWINSDGNIIDVNSCNYFNEMDAKIQLFLKNLKSMF